MENPRQLAAEWLVAELAKRGEDDVKPQCGSGRKESYDTALHVFALILILSLSTFACGFPLVSSQSRSRRSNDIVFYCQHFGTGVLIATAFVHLLPTAFTSLTDPCLPYFFSEGYKPLPGLIAMVSVLVVVGIESFLTTRGARHSHAYMWTNDDGVRETEICHAHGGGGSIAARRGSDRPAHIELQDLGASEGLMAGISPLAESTPISQVNGANETRPDRSTGKSIDHDENDDDCDSMDLEMGMEELLDVSSDAADTRPLTRPATDPKMSVVPRTPALGEQQKRLMLQCLLLEAGILFHSVFIGMAISVATGPPFVVFLIAIAFHQTFEGLALGSRIAALGLPMSSPTPWLMVLAYGTTTPIGQAIGLIVHKFYDPMSQTSLLLVGSMNAISSGLLLFAGLVQLLAEDFLTEKSYETLHGRRRVHAFLAISAGGALMALVGAFA